MMQLINLLKNWSAHAKRNYYLFDIDIGNALAIIAV